MRRVHKKRDFKRALCVRAIQLRILDAEALRANGLALTARSLTLHDRHNGLSGGDTKIWDVLTQKKWVFG